MTRMYRRGSGRIKQQQCCSCRICSYPRPYIRVIVLNHAAAGARAQPRPLKECDVRRVLVIGSGGAGKSTLAVRIGERLGLPVVHLDALYWRPGWVPTPADEWARTVGRLAARDAWVMDGNYGGTLDARLAACDTVVFLDLPRWLCAWRVARRVLRFHGRSRPSMAPGCPERLSLEFLRWVWEYPRQRRPGVLRRLAALDAGQRAVILRSTADVDRFVARLPTPVDAPTSGNAGSPAR
jgi:adenylate kinase family enzyme